LLDPKNFEVKEALGDAQASDATLALREAAVLVDRARDGMRKTDPDAALKPWKGLIERRWSMVGWFDSDERR
jgi:hypothetical protein